MNTGECRGCKATMRWIRMPSGKGNPVDLAPVADGNIVIDRSDDDGVDHGHVLTKTELAQDPPGDRYISHFATCPMRNRFRR